MNLKQYEADGLLYSQVHPTLPLTVYNYTDRVQYEGLWDEVTLQCRGLVVDNLGNIVARPFKKFFNLSEGRTNVTDDYEIYTKYDGSLFILFFFGGEWVFASRGSFTSEQAVKGFELLSKYDYKSLDKDNTYCFEVIFKENRIVVDYGDYEDVILTGVFNTKTGEEKDINCWFLPHARIHRKDTPLEKLCEDIKDNEEGYVVKFSNGERCKIKGAEYLRLHKMMSQMSTTAVWDCLRNGDSILELLSGYPDEFYNSVREYEEYLIGLFSFFESTIKLEYLKHKHIESDKEFAEIIKDYKYKHILFSLRNDKRIDEQIYRLIKPEYKKL
jgi:RNA ligase